MDNPRPEKVTVVDEVRARLDASTAAILTEYRGMTVKDLSALRQGLAAVGAQMGIYKNTLVRIAAKDLSIEGLDELLTGPTAIVFVKDDAGAAAKALRDASRTNPLLVVKGGLLGDKVVDAEGAKALADLPSKEQLLSQIAGLFQAPMQQLASLLNNVQAQISWGLQALIDQKGGAPEGAADTADTPTEQEQ
jgi:large subunit ribosomal protein L10